MRKVFYTPISTKSFGQKGTTLYAVQATTMIYRPEFSNPMEINMKGESHTDACSKLMKFLKPPDGEIHEMNLEEVDILQMKTEDSETEFYVYKGWYVQKGGTIVNHSLATFYDGLNVDDLYDDNVCSSVNPIDCPAHLFMLIES